LSSKAAPPKEPEEVVFAESKEEEEKPEAKEEVKEETKE
jgi:hypothetical protein